MTGRGGAGEAITMFWLFGLSPGVMVNGDVAKNV